MPDAGFEAMLLAQGAKYVPPAASLRAARPGALPRPPHAAAVRVSARLDSHRDGDDPSRVLPTILSTGSYFFAIRSRNVSRRPTGPGGAACSKWAVV